MGRRIALATAVLIGGSVAALVIAALAALVAGVQPAARTARVETVAADRAAALQEQPAGSAGVPPAAVAGAAPTTTGTPQPASATASSAADAPASQPSLVHPGPLDLVPAESLLCWKGLPYPDTQRPGETQPNAIVTLINAGVLLLGDRLDPRARLFVDVLQAFGEIIRYPFAIALIDARAKEEKPDSRKVDQLRVAVIVRTNGQSLPLLRMLQRIVSTHTDSGQAALERRQTHGRAYQELMDRRLSDWCVLAWGELDDYFVLTIGREVWPQIAAVAAGEATAISRDAWLAPVRATYRQEPLIEIIVAAKAIRERLDPFVEGRATAFFRAWEADDIDQAHWALGFEGRCLYCRAYFRDDRTRIRKYADPSFAEPRHMELVPNGARYAVYRLPVSRFLPKLIAAFYATRSPGDRAFAERRWAQIQAELGLDAQRDALDNLGETIVLHNDPPHPLRMPLAFTSLLEIRREPAQVRATLEKLCAAWQAALEKEAEARGEPNAALLERDDDGVWYLQFGPVAGLSWTFTDQYIVTSWSPKALREYLSKAGARVGRRSF